MTSSQDKEIFIIDENNNRLDGEILFTFEANGDHFALYVIEEKVYAGKVDEENNLRPIEEDEWKLVEKVFNEYMEKMEQEDDN